MVRMRRHPIGVRGFFFGTLALLLGAPALAQDAASYPTRPIMMIVPFAPGGASDFVARVVQDRLGKILGQQIVVDNRPGAAGIIGTEIAAQAAPDGYTTFLGNVGTISINPAFYPDMRIKPDKSLIPVSLLAEQPGILVARPDFPADDLKGLIAYVKAHPGKVTYAAPAAGTLNTLEMELFRREAGLDMVLVPYKGGAGPAMTDLLGGHVDIMFTTISTAMQFVRAKRLKGFAVTTKERMPELPDVPSMVELGWPNHVASSWQGLLVPAGTPRPIIDKLHAACVQAVADPGIQERMKKGGVLAVASKSPEEFKAYVASETARWSRAIAASGAHAER